MIYHSEIRYRFPTLQVLDNEALSKIKFDVTADAPQTVGVLSEVKGSFIDSDATKAPVYDFLSRFEDSLH
jgi:hypothetical protein